MNSSALIFVNSFAILVLLLTLRNYRQKFKHICCEEKIFVLFILSTLAILVIETVLDTLWMQPGRAIQILLYILQVVDFSLTIIIPMLWLYYCLFRIYHIASVSRTIRCLIALPAVLFVLLLLATLPGGVAFKIDESNQYIRGIAYVASFVAGYLYIAAALLLITVKRKTLNRGELVPYILVPAIPITLGIVEAVLALPLVLIWAGTSLVILDIQMLVLNNRTNIDHITSLNNRMALDTYVRRMIHESHGLHTQLGIIMIDVDDFKSINDQYGHVEGDRALKATANILREAFAGKHFIARYGGDEFTVVFRDCSPEMLETYLEKLEAERMKHNKFVNRPYDIRLSIGASVFTDQEITSLHSVYMKVDSLMYKNKKERKALQTEANP